MKGIGIDLVYIERFDKNLNTIKRFLSEVEYEIYLNKTDDEKAKYAASRWASKEAYVKATSDKAFEYKRMSILNDENGKPSVYIDGEIQKNILISISHEKDLANVVIVII